MNEKYVSNILSENQRPLHFKIGKNLNCDNKKIVLLGSPKKTPGKCIRIHFIANVQHSYLNKQPISVHLNSVGLC